ncbi:MAG: TlyA family RNA methyltransferase [Alphaproteobacteria bacterium]|nr:TlyA family RNA methyltransferase [Alphaproteobacteria bacterium]
MFKFKTPLRPKPPQKLKIKIREKVRADHLLVTLGIAENRSKAQAFIKDGHIFHGDVPIEKGGELFPADTILDYKGKTHSWVSRGGLKLDYALQFFNLSPENKICMDVGASTGGFTQVLLEKGASKVYAIDVGHDQLDFSLQDDSRVINIERMNARALTSVEIPEKIDVIVCDTSFISLIKVLETPLTFAQKDAWLVALIKPQFEVGKGFVGKGGIVREPDLHEKSIQDVSIWLETQNWKILGVTESPILGSNGNKEFLIASIKL